MVSIETIINTAWVRVYVGNEMPTLDPLSCLSILVIGEDGPLEVPLMDHMRHLDTACYGFYGSFLTLEIQFILGMAEAR